MRVLLVSTYDLGRQPFGLASPAAWLRRAGFDVAQVDASRDEVTDAALGAASVIAFYLPMHTATRLAVPIIGRARRVNPSAALCAYGLYAPMNAAFLIEQGVDHVVGPEAEESLVAIAAAREASLVTGATPSVDARGGARQGRVTVPAGGRATPRLQFIPPDRTGLPDLARYAALTMPDGTARIVGSTDATRGCKHLCRHCPIVPVYKGQFRVVALDVVLEDLRRQVANGAQHISFGDPDFLNAPTHATRILRELRRQWPDLTFDVTIKVEHLLRHAELLPLLRDAGCLFVTTAVESVDDEVLTRLRKGHTRADFIEVVARCRDVGLTLSPTFVPFTPWTTVQGYVDLLQVIGSLGLVEQVAPIQLAIRLLIPAGSALLDLEEVQAVVDPFDASSLTWPWRNPDDRVDHLQSELMSLVAASAGAARSIVFDAIWHRVHTALGLPPPHYARTGMPIPVISEPWYCCAEPSPTQLGAI